MMYDVWFNQYNNYHTQSCIYVTMHNNFTKISDIDKIYYLTTIIYFVYF